MAGSHEDNVLQMGNDVVKSMQHSIDYEDDYMTMMLMFGKCSFSCRSRPFRDNIITKRQPNSDIFNIKEKPPKRRRTSTLRFLILHENNYVPNCRIKAISELPYLFVLESL